jgi:hypothetical protein
MSLRVLVAALAIVVCGCGAKPPPPAPPLPPPLHPPTEASCELAEATLVQLDCRRDDGSPWARTKQGASFADACKIALRDGRYWMSNCIARITDCSMLMPAYRGEWCGARDGGTQ